MSAASRSSQSLAISTSTSSGTNNKGNGQAKVSDVKVPPAEDYLRIRVINSDGNSEVIFRLKLDIPFIRMKRAYATRLGLVENEIRFIFDGLRITDDDTPRKLGLVNDDVIEIYQEKTGGM